MSFWGQLKRRNVFRVGIAYLAAVWVLVQVADTVLPAFSTPTWVMQALVLAAALGFLLVVVLAWFYEVTPEGIKADSEIQATPAVKFTGRKLDFLIIGLLVLAVGFLAVDSFVPEGRDSVLLNSVAVLPFQNLSPDPDNAYFAAGIHEEVLNQLAKVGALNVIARTSMLAYAGTVKSIPEIARELNVQAVMEGSVRYDQDRVRITTQLIDAMAGTQLWSETYEREFDDIFAIESSIAMNIANALKAQFSLAEQAAIETPPTRSPEAYKTYLLARSAARQQNTPGAPLALDYLDEAIALDPEFALAYAWKAYGYVTQLLATVGVNAVDSAEQAEVERIAKLSAEKALELEPGLWLALRVLGRIHELHWRWVDAAELYEQAVQTTPRSERAWLVNWKVTSGELEEAIRIQRELVELEPLVANSHWRLAVFNAYAGETEAAMTSIGEALRLAPNVHLMHIWLAHIEGMRGNATVALSELRRAEQFPGVHVSPITIADLAYAYGWHGHQDDARRLWRILEDRAPDHRLHAGTWALAHFAVGDEEAARAALEIVVNKVTNEEPDAGWLALEFLRWNIYSDPVLEKPVFQRLRSLIWEH